MLRPMTHLLTICVLVISCTKQSHAQKLSKQLLSEGYKRYSIPHCTVTYEVTGNQKGTETISFDRYGLREAKLTNTEINVAGMSIKTNTLTIMDGEVTYSFDLTKKTGSKIGNTMLTTIAGKADEKDLGKIGETMMKRMNAKRTGTGEIAGKKCDIWEISSLGSKSWVWNAISLKTDVGLGGMKITNTATKVDASAVAESAFSFPPGIKIEEKGNLQDVMKRMKQGKKN